MSSDNKQQNVQPDPAQTLNTMLTQGGVTPQPVSNSGLAVIEVRGRIDNSVAANQQTTNTEQVNVQGSVIGRNQLLEQYRGRESEMLNNYKELSNVSIQPTVDNGVRITATIPADYVRINPQTNRPELAGNGIQTVDNNGNLTRGFDLRRTTLSPNADGTYTMRQDYRPKNGRSALDRASYGVRYDSNPPVQNRGFNVGIGVRFDIGSRGLERGRLQPSVGYNNVSGNANIPLYGDPNRPNVSPDSVRATVLINTPQQTNTNNQTQGQQQENGNQITPLRPPVQQRGM